MQATIVTFRGGGRSRSTRRKINAARRQALRRRYLRPGYWPLADISVCTANVRFRGGEDRVIGPAFSGWLAEATAIKQVHRRADSGQRKGNEFVRRGSGFDIAQSARRELR